MKRLPLALLLIAFAAPALAINGVNASPDGGAAVTCSKARTVRDNERVIEAPAPAKSTAASAVPARNPQAQSKPATPRWNSLLPGMIR